MGVAEVLLNEGKGWESIEKKINVVKKSIGKIDTAILQIQKDIQKAGGEPEDFTINAGYATENLLNILWSAQKWVDKLKG